MQIWMPLYFLKVIQVSEMGMAYATLTVGGTSLIVSLSMATISDRIFKNTQNVRAGRVKVTGIGMLLGGLFLDHFILSNRWRGLSSQLHWRMDLATLLFQHPISLCAISFLNAHPLFLERLLPFRTSQQLYAR